jgi:hypothetical protein
MNEWRWCEATGCTRNGPVVHWSVGSGKPCKEDDLAGGGPSSGQFFPPELPICGMSTTAALYWVQKNEQQQGTLTRLHTAVLEPEHLGLKGR